MIKTLALKFGRGPGIKAETIALTPITVFVGPNNSGKSSSLKELFRRFSSGSNDSRDFIIDRVEFDSVTEADAKKLVDSVTIDPHPSESVHPGHIVVGGKQNRIQIDKTELIRSTLNPNSSPVYFCSFCLKFLTLMIDGRSRIDLVNQQPAGDMQQLATSSLQVLFRDDKRREIMRRIVFNAFGKYFTIDPTNIGQLRIRLASRAPISDQEERGYHQAAVDFHASADPIENASDGVKAFVGIMTEIIAGDPAILLIDEPEAFLHPALSSTLGKEISTASAGSDKRVFVSTHSPNFVMGCIQSGAPVNIVRLTYRDGVGAARLLPSAEILRLMRNPLLRSTGVLSGLFYEFVVVTESDADRAFYQEINERLLREKPELGIPNCLFLNAQNKQTVQTIIRPLRDLGIPAVGVVDIDVLKDGGAIWTDFLSSGFVPQLDQQPLGQHRAAIKKAFDDENKNMKRDGGLQALSPHNRESGNNLFDRLAEYGLFVVRGGELESWLSKLGAKGHGPSWLIDIFQKMGEEPEAPGYLHPSDDDVWEFLGRMKVWLTNGQRKGIPS